MAKDASRPERPEQNTGSFQPEGPPFKAERISFVNIDLGLRALRFTPGCRITGFQRFQPGKCPAAPAARLFVPPAPARAGTASGTAQRAIPTIALNTYPRYWIAFEGVAPLHAARTSQRDVPTTLNTYVAGRNRRFACATSKPFFKHALSPGLVSFCDRTR